MHMSSGSWALYFCASGTVKPGSHAQGLPSGAHQDTFLPSTIFWLLRACHSPVCRSPSVEGNLAPPFPPSAALTLQPCWTSLPPASASPTGEVFMKQSWTGWLHTTSAFSSESQTLLRQGGGGDSREVKCTFIFLFIQQSLPCASTTVIPVYWWTSSFPSKAHFLAGDQMICAHTNL
jgi:hypothetical protein